MTRKRGRKIPNKAKSACLGKIKHKSMLAAEYTLDRMRLNVKDNHLLEVYKCEFCKFYHIGHNYKNKNAEDKKLYR